MEKQLVLVPLDGSVFSRQIIPAIQRLLHPERYQLILLHVLDPSAPVAESPLHTLATYYTPIYQTSYEQRQEVAQAFHDPQADFDRMIGAELRTLEKAGYTVTTVVQFGDPAQEIVSTALARHVDMVAMATHGRIGMHKLLMGSVMEQVLHELTLPLLLVHPQSKVDLSTTCNASHKILVPLDGSACAEEALIQAQIMAAATNATLVLVAAAPLPADAALVAAGVVPSWQPAEDLARRQQLSRYLHTAATCLASAGLQVNIKLSADSPDEAILHTSEMEQADLIVMATHGRSGLPRLLLGSVAAQVVHSANRPVLLVRSVAQPSDYRHN